MPLFADHAGPQMFPRAQDASRLLRVKDESFQVLDALVAVLCRADETQRGAVTTVKGLPAEAGRKEHVGAEQVLEQEDSGVPVRAFSGDELGRCASRDKRADDFIPYVAHADALPMEILCGPGRDAVKVASLETLRQGVEVRRVEKQRYFEAYASDGQSKASRGRRRPQRIVCKAGKAKEQTLP